MLSFLRKIKNLRLKKIGAKDAAIFLLNRKLPALTGSNDLGRVVDLRLDRPGKSLAVDIGQEERVSSVAIKNYRFVLNKGQSYLTWDTIHCQGDEAKRFGKALSAIKQIEVPRRYMGLLEVIL